MLFCVLKSINSNSNFMSMFYFAAVPILQLQHHPSPNETLQAINEKVIYSLLTSPPSACLAVLDSMIVTHASSCSSSILERFIHCRHLKNGGVATRIEIFLASALVSRPVPRWQAAELSLLWEPALSLTHFPLNSSRRWSVVVAIQRTVCYSFQWNV